MNTVYIHTCPNNKIYVGQTKQSVRQRWLKGKGYSDNPYFSNAIRKYGWDKIRHEIVASNLTDEQADNLERDLILKYDSTNPEFGYNIQLGGHGLHTQSDKTKNQISNSMLGVVKTIQHRKNISESKKGVCSEKLLNSACQNLSKANQVVRGDEYRKKMSDAKKGKPGRVWTQEQKDKLRATRLKQVQSAKSTEYIADSNFRESRLP